MASINQRKRTNATSGSPQHSSNSSSNNPFLRGGNDEQYTRRMNTDDHDDNNDDNKYNGKFPSFCVWLRASSSTSSSRRSTLVGMAASILVLFVTMTTLMNNRALSYTTISDAASSSFSSFRGGGGAGRRRSIIPLAGGRTLTQSTNTGRYPRLVQNHNKNQKDAMGDFIAQHIYVLPPRIPYVEKADEADHHSEHHHHHHNHHDHHHNNQASDVRTVPGMTDDHFLKNLKDSHSYDHLADEFENEQCKAQYDWQLHSFPACNTIHEMHMASQVKLIDNGHWRDVFVSKAFPTPHVAQHEPVVFKTQRREHDLTPRNFDRHRRDALIMERLTAHPFVMDIYGFCANAGLFEFAPGGDISNNVRNRTDPSKTPSKLERFHIAVQAAISIASLHNFDQEGRPSVASTDISSNQWVKDVHGIYKLQDFNRARFLRTDRQTGGICTFRVGSNPGKNRAPEEYRYDGENHMVDVYSLGNIFYLMLTLQSPFKNVSEKRAKRMIKHGEKPELPTSVQTSTDPIDVALRTAMQMCHITDPEKRTPAREVETYLKKALEEIDPGRLDSWLKILAKK